MTPPDESTATAPSAAFFADFKIYHELMASKVRHVLLVSSPYDAFILEEDGSLATRIITEYSGLNLSHPPRVTRIANARRALEIIAQAAVDLVLTMPHLDDMDAFSFGAAVKALRPGLPVILLAHSLQGIFPATSVKPRDGIDRIAVWSGNSDLLLALVKNVEDRMNVAHDCRRAQVRVLLLVEDNPLYQSLLLPLVYKEVVRQTQAILMEGLNEDHRLLKMRARPKILLAESHDEAVAIYERYRQYIFGVISDTGMPRDGVMDPDAGWDLLTRIRSEIPDLPLLLLSANPENAARAAAVPAAFLDKNAPHLLAEIHTFFLTHLGFGDFIFRLPDGTEVTRAANLRELQQRIAEVPEDCLIFHARRNHFSNWIMGRSEIALASSFRTVSADAFDEPNQMRRYLIDNIKALRRLRQKGVVAQFKGTHYDPEVMDFVRIGSGSLGGKARSLAFISTMLPETAALHEAFPTVDIRVPRTLVICTDGFEAFLSHNRLGTLAAEDLPNAQIARRFMAADMPPPWLAQLTAFSRQVAFPLSVRSSSLLEDARFQPYAGLYETYMIPNNHPDPDVRLAQLTAAVKLVYASTFYENPRAYARHIAIRPQEEAMAVIIQELAGSRHGRHFYPTFAGVAQSHNFYPIPPMRAEDGIAMVAMGMGRTVVQGEQCLRFSPRHPGVMPQFSTVADMLDGAQRFFYALRVEGCPETPDFFTDANLDKRDVDDAAGEFPVRTLASTYSIDEHRIRDYFNGSGPAVITFASVLKYRRFPLADLLVALLAIGRQAMGCPVEMEFAVDLAPEGSARKDVFHWLQMRPMAAGVGAGDDVDISAGELAAAVCRSSSALGNGRLDTLTDVVYVRHERFEASATLQMAEAIGRFNAALCREKRPYLLAGPGRWGSADRWLGIPVQWHQISAVGAIVEIRSDLLPAEPSQGSHFFQNITALGIPYLTVNEAAGDRFDRQWLDGQPAAGETDFIRHVRLDAPLGIRINGRTGQGVILPPAR